MHSVQQQAQLVRVTTAYTPENLDPLKVMAGEIVLVSEKSDLWNDHPGWLWVWCTDPRGKSAWSPANLLENGGEPGQTPARYDYDASELGVSIGEMITIEREESGWFWCVNTEGRRGWVPIDHVDRVNHVGL